MISSPSPSPSPSSSRTPKGGSATPPRTQASKWRSGAVRGVYGRRLLDALRATGGGQPRAVKAAADSALALTARGQTRWSRAILLAGAACSRRRVLVKAGGKVRRRRRPPPPVQARDNVAAAAALLKGKGKDKDKDKVQERLRVLGRLVPGCRKLPAPALLEETADYVAALQMQGFRSFVWTAVSYQMKDVMKLSPSTSQFLVSLAYFPWSIKPIYGILSDCIPIKQRKRIPYLIISSCLSLLPWLILGLSQTLRSSANMLTALLVVQNLGSAMADVVIDAMVAEAVRSAGPEFAGDLQSLSWSSMAVGGIFGSLLGGYALSNLPIHAIYVVFSALPFLQLVSSMFVEDFPKGFHSANDEHKYVDNQSSVTAFSEKGSSEALRYEGTRRRKGTRKNNKRRSLSKRTESDEKYNGSINSLPSLSLRSAFFSLCTAFKQPNILRPMAWFFFSNVTIPNISTVMFYYQTEDLNLEASFLGTARVIGWFSLMLGTYTYNRYFKQKKLRNILVFAHVGLAVITLLDIVLVSRLHVQYGIADKYMVLWGSALGDAINQFKPWDPGEWQWLVLAGST